MSTSEDAASQTAQTVASFDPHAVTRFGGYEVVRYLAEGGMAWVYEVRDPRFPARKLALKVLKPQAGQGELFHRFVAEAKLLAGVDHPNLVTIFDLARDEATRLAYYTMTFVEGDSFVKANPVPWRSAVGPFLGILDGLAELHDRGVIHRDIKPGNMLLKTDGRALLADLGIARDPDSAGLTQLGTVMGTPAYMPPEQAAGKPVDARADLFAIGLSIYRVVSGRTVYQSVEGVDSRSSQSILYHLAGCSSRGEELAFDFPDSIPPALRRIIVKACQFDPDARYATAAELRNDLAALVERSSPRIDAEAATRAVPAPTQRLDPENCDQIGDFEVVRFVAEGGMGWVFEARSSAAPDERLALKALKPGIGSDAELVRFRAEAELLAGIDHPNLMGVVDTGLDEPTGTSFYTMPFIDSPPLSERGKIAPAEALRIVDGVLTALAELHRRGIVHRDVKPANILLGENSVPILMDLGIARQSNQQTMTSTGMFLGTALYASPEQARGARVGPESDVFAVGLLLHRLVTGSSAYAGVSDIDLGNDTSILFHLAKLEHAGEELCFEIPKDVPPAVCELIHRACRYKPEDRYADALVMRTALRQARRDPARRQAQRSTRSVPIVAAATLAGLAFGATTLDWAGLQDRAEAGIASISEEASASPISNAADGAARGTTDGAVAPESTAVARTGVAVEAAEGGGPIPLRRVPADATLAAGRGGRTALAVEVDPSAGNMMYSWRVDGRSIGVDLNRYVHEGNRTANVEVSITNRRGEQTVESWIIEAQNQNPRLGLVPSTSRVEIEVGDQRRFAARASDPDGDSVNVEYLIGDQVVGQGGSFVFSADRPGDYRLIARASDGRGGMTEVERFVRVTGTTTFADPLGFDEFPASPQPVGTEALVDETPGNFGSGGGGGPPPPPGGAMGPGGGGGGNMAAPRGGGRRGGGRPRGGRR